MLTINHGFHMRSDRVKKLICLFFIIVLVIGRRPELFIEPRFIEEEGTVFFAYAFNHSWWENLLMQYGGYYSLCTNSAAALAVLFPFDIAPLVTTYVAFIFDIIPCCIVISGNSIFWNSWPKKIIIAASIPLLSFGGSWLSSIHIQYYLALTAFMILLENSEGLSLSKKVSYRILLILAGLTGAVNTFLVPVYFIKAMGSKTRENKIQTGILTATGLIQIMVFLTTYFGNDVFVNSHRFGKSGIDLLWSMIIFQFVYPYFGYTMFNFPFIALILKGGTISLFFIHLFLANIRDSDNQLVIFSFVIVFVLSAISSVNTIYVPRY